MLTKFIKILMLIVPLTLVACASDGDENIQKISVGHDKVEIVGQDYQTVIDLFKDANFENIQVLRIESEEFKDHRNGEVIDVKLGELTDFNKDTEVNQDAKVVISYVVSENYSVMMTSEAARSVNNFHLFKSSDYLLFNDSNDLGWEETWTITIEAEPSGLVWEDFSYSYDSELLEVTKKEIRYDATKSYLDFEVKSKMAGSADTEVCALSEEGNKCFSFSVNCLDEVEGRRVYLIPTQDTYHYSEECLDEDGIMTTYHFVASKGIKECPKCTNDTSAKEEVK